MVISLRKALMALMALMLLFPSKAVIVKVEEISSYKMEVNADNGHVKCEITIRNLVKNPVVPGVGELRLQKQEPQRILIFPIPNTKVDKAVNVTHVKAYSGNTIIPVKVIQKENYTIIQYEIWTPIEPMGSYTFTIEFYTQDLIDRGLLFKSLTIPVGADVDIAYLELKPVSSWHLTFTEPKMDSDKWIARIPADHIAFFTAEFSIIPLTILPIRGYILFWGIILLVILFIALKGRKKRRGK